MTAHSPAPAGLHTSASRLPVEDRLPSFDGATGWLNSQPLTAADLRGKTVLANFWTYTCVNWLRQLPYLRAWAGKYADHNLIVIGVHTPEFSFEHDLASVRTAVGDMQIEYPVAIDNNFAVWRAFGNPAAARRSASNRP
jgi:thiol-disulfide isomerase/thioredoxin